MGSVQRVTPPRGMASVGPQVRAGPRCVWGIGGFPLLGCIHGPFTSQSYGGSMRPPPNSLAGPGLPTMNM